MAGEPIVQARMPAVFVGNVRVSVRRSPPWSVSRTHAVTDFWWTSSPGQRSTNVSIAASFRGFVARRSLGQR